MQKQGSLTWWLPVFTCTFLALWALLSINPPPVRAKTNDLSPMALSSSSMVFNSDRTGNNEVFVLDLKTKQVKQLTSNSAYDSFFPRISPNLESIVFVRTPRGVHDTDATKNSLWIMNADGSNLREVVPAGGFGWQVQGHPEWLPNGSGLVMVGGLEINPQIVRIDANGKNPVYLTSREGTNTDPKPHPSGGSFVFQACPQAVCYGTDFEVYKQDLSPGLAATRMTSDKAQDQDPAYSPDGSKIAWLRNTVPTGWGGAGIWQVFLMNADGSGQRNLTRDQAINSRPEWSADGTLVYFHRMKPIADAKFDIYSIKTDGTGLTKVTFDQPGNNEYPSLPTMR